MHHFPPNRKRTLIIKCFLAFQLLCGLSFSCIAQSIDIGVTQVFPAADNGNANLLIVQQTSLGQAATLKNLNFYATQAAGSLILGVYDATGTNGGPGNLLATTAQFSPTVGWNMQPVLAPVALPAGSYWLAYFPSSNALAFRKQLAGNCYYYNLNFGALPSVFVLAAANNLTVEWSFYASLDTSTDSITPPATPNPTPSPGSSPNPLAYPLKVSGNQRYLTDQNAVPFMVIGDSAWNLIVNLSESDAAVYFANRKADGFNTVLLCLLVGPDAFGRSDFSTFDGIIPFTTPGDISTPNPAYFQRVDEMIHLAASYGLCVFLNPIENYGWETNFENAGPAKCAAFGNYLGVRYASFPNIVWFHGNDYQDWPDADSVFLAIINAIKAVDPLAIHTMELNYVTSASFDDPNLIPILDLNLSYTYYPAYAQGLHCYASSVTAPYILGETSYEQESYGSSDPGTPENVRRQAWWTALSGSTGQLYGSYWTDKFETGWQDNLNTPGALAMGYLAATLQHYAWYNLVPDSLHTFVTAGYGTQFPYPGNMYRGGDTKGTLASDTFVTAAITPDGTFGVAYLPTTSTITVNMTQFSAPVTVKWVDPSSGAVTVIRGSPFSPAGSEQFTTPGQTSDGQNDWVLLFSTT
jgi:hypothetical protein